MSEWQPKQRGLTLIELLVTLSIAVILMTIAVPSFQDFFRRNRIESAVSNLMGSLNLARSEAIRRGVNVRVCKSSNGTDCNTDGNDWEQGWIVRVGNDAPLRVQQRLPAELTVRANPPFEDEIVFRPSGRITQNGGGSFFICHGGTTVDARRIVVIGTGRTRVEAASSCAPT